MAINRIIKLGLEEEAGRLAADPKMNPGKIAEELTQISGQNITRGTVLRYFGTNKDPVQKAAKAREEIVVRAITERLDTAAQLKDINRRALRILEHSEMTDDPRTAIMALKEIREQLALQAKLIGDLPPDGAVTVNILQNPDFLKFQTVIEEVICDGCRQRLHDRLRQIAGE